MIIIIIGLLIWQGIEFFSHQRIVKKIPVRIHVNGSRGKSSVVRLISGGLRASGMKVLAKTTGTLPRIIFPDGREIPIVRHRSASIYEQVRFFRFADKLNPEVVVLECMAVQPVYQWITEHQMVHATHGVITNIRPDHIREMGPDLPQIARSLGNTVPSRGKVFIGGEFGHKIIKEIAGRRKSDLIEIDVPEPSPEEMSRFGYLEHEENVRIALQVCQSLGVDRKTALEGMWAAPPDVGALKKLRIEKNGKTLHFLSAFAANDPESTLRICKNFRLDETDTELILLNSREDRIERSYQLIEMINRNLNPAAVFLIGKVTRKMLGMGRKNIPFIDASEYLPERLLSEMLEMISSEGVVYAIGNMGGGGLNLVNYLYETIKEKETEITGND